MAISEESRHQLYTRLEEVLGTTGAATLMEHLPPVGWADVATKRDLDHLASVLRSDMDGRFAALDARFAGVDARLAGVDVRLAELAADLRREMAMQAAELRSEITMQAADLRRQIGDTRNSLRTFFLGLVGLQLSGAGLALAVARLA